MFKRLGRFGTINNANCSPLHTVKSVKQILRGSEKNCLTLLFICLLYFYTSTARYHTISKVYIGVTSLNYAYMHLINSPVQLRQKEFHTENRKTNKTTQKNNYYNTKGKMNKLPRTRQQVNLLGMLTRLDSGTVSQKFLVSKGLYIWQWTIKICWWFWWFKHTISI